MYIFYPKIVKADRRPFFGNNIDFSVNPFLKDVFGPLWMRFCSFHIIFLKVFVKMSTVVDALTYQKVPVPKYEEYKALSVMEVFEAEHILVSNRPLQHNMSQFSDRLQ